VLDLSRQSILTFAGVCQRMLTYAQCHAHVCACCLESCLQASMLTCSDVCAVSRARMRLRQCSTLFRISATATSSCLQASDVC
jgi:hypothetical protein